MNLKLSVILGFIFAVLTDAADSTTTTCTDNLQCSSCLCVSTNNSMTFAKGDTTTICAHFVTVNNTSGCIVAERAAYPVVVDTFSSIQLTGGQTYFQNYGFVEIVIQVYGTVMSVPLVTYLQLTEFYSSAFSIIIELNNGVVQSAYWDHECATCSSSDCYQFTMSNGTLIDNICNSPSCISTNDSSCDPQIYVAWIGTDSKGNQLTSAGMRLSRFDQFSLSDIISANTISPYVIPTPTNTTTNSSSGGNTTGAGNTTDTSGNKTDTNTTTPGNTTNTTDTSGNKTDTNTTTTNTTDTSGNKTDTNTTDTKTPTETSTSPSSGDSSSSPTDTGPSTSPGTDTSTKDGTSTTTGTDTSSGDTSSSTPDTGSPTSTGTDTSTKGETTVTKL